MVGFSVGFFWYQIGSASFLESFFNTVAHNLENRAWGSKYPVIMDGNETELLLLHLQAGEYIPQWDKAQEICIRLMDHPSEAVRANAALGLAYTARNTKKLDKRIVKPYLLRELRENKEYNWRIQDAIEDINWYLGWNLASKKITL